MSDSLGAQAEGVPIQELLGVSLGVRAVGVPIQELLDGPTDNVRSSVVFASSSASHIQQKGQPEIRLTIDDL
ncbi:hypothetical protein [Cohnella sp. OV330]|uniref:hypothetical protein n=1 Tax=Cohnella sp. OV330 TaxID=1855288 RepID=UPI00116061DC|nr:hypothetical protein [Cohnella sp. OV330]